MQTTKNRKFPPVGNSLLYILLLSVAFGRVRPIQGRTLQKGTDDSDMYNRAFPVGNALFLFAGGMMSLFRLP